MTAFPVDAETLSLVRLCFESNGPKLSGVLDLLSGRDPTSDLVRELPNIDGHAGVVTTESEAYTRDDVIRALIAEVVRLRAAERSTT